MTTENASSSHDDRTQGTCPQTNPHLGMDRPFPLEGILVIDLSRLLAGPVCGRMLADAGARVIHVERTGRGDDSRMLPPFTKDNVSEYYRIANTGKESVTLDFKDPTDMALLQRMITKADVLLENFRPGVMSHLGLDPQELVERHPRLIVASISGFGQWGPMSTQAAYDTVVQAYSGIMDLTGYPERTAVRVGTSVADMVAGQLGYAGITTALYARERTGRGTTVDISMLDGTFTLLEQGLTSAEDEGAVLTRVGNRHPFCYPFDLYECSDSSIYICTANDHLWRSLATALGHSEWIDDPRMKGNPDRAANWEYCGGLIGTVLKTDTAEHWLRVIQDAGVPVAPVLNVEDTRNLPQIAARGMLKELKDGNIAMGTPIKYGAWNSYGSTKDAPTLDEEGDAIRAEFS